MEQMSVEASIFTINRIEINRRSIDCKFFNVFSFSVPESAKSGTIVGEINDLDKYLMTDDEKKRRTPCNPVNAYKWREEAEVESADGTDENGMED
ncbi:unnamed protein product, partial [Mesorhabditis belari]|uniref:Uncharacterized protein n=1 Tax=Mesorhabditis belari TaxID=2138241 RepID=A0AAF3JBI5_9BILA